MAFQIGSVIFVHADARCTLTPKDGPKKGQPFTVLACTKLTGDSAGKAIEAKGNSINAVAMALGEVSHSFAVGLDVGQVSVDYLEHAGDGAARMLHDVTITLNRPGLPPVTYIRSDAIIEKGFGLSSDAGAQVKDEISGKSRTATIKYKGKEYDPWKLPGTLE